MSTEDSKDIEKRDPGPLASLVSRLPNALKRLSTHRDEAAQRAEKAQEHADVARSEVENLDELIEAIRGLISMIREEFQELDKMASSVKGTITRGQNRLKERLEVVESMLRDLEV